MLPKHCPGKAGMPAPHPATPGPTGARVGAADVLRAAHGHPSTPHLVFGAGEGPTSWSPLCPGRDTLLGTGGEGPDPASGICYLL